MYLRKLVVVFAVLLLLGLATAACEQSGPAEPGPVTSGRLTFQAPQGWVEETPSSGMRQAQYRLPSSREGVEDAELAVFIFPGSGGTVQANVERWINQFSSPQPGAGAPASQVSERTVNGLKVTLVDVSGTYSPGPMMGGDGPKENYRMLGAIVETPTDPWFFKLTGAAETVSHWEDSFYKFVESFRLE